jgi:two-component system NtrC family sensor kinase
MDFMKKVTRALMDSSGCDSVELWLKRRDRYYRCESIRSGKQPFSLGTVPCNQDQTEEIRLASLGGGSRLDLLRSEILHGRTDASRPFFTPGGSFWTGDTDKPLNLRPRGDSRASGSHLRIGGDYKSLVIVPIRAGDERTGLLQLRSKRQNFFTQEDPPFYEGVAEIIGVSLKHRLAQIQLRERVKELTCLYGMAQLVARPDASLEEVLQGIVELVPPGWLYPEITSVRLVLDQRTYTTPGFREGPDRLRADVDVAGQTRGFVEVVYAEQRPRLDEGPFLKEERSLIDAIAKELAHVIQRRQSEEERQKLQEQLRHADRLATIGQLAAGVAHELNEPLSSVLGFAQLAKKCPGLPQQAESDVEMIVKASLHAREVVKKLMLFSRQTPPRAARVDLNAVVEEGLYFLNSRCAKEGIQLVRKLAADLPYLAADPSQLQQVLVNIVVNAIQAMPRGGTLTVQTRSEEEDRVVLVVEDTGVGMSREVVRQMFVPFFTTKGVGQGTGLGLSVVHGIVASHGGTVEVESEVGRGTRFEIRLPAGSSPDSRESD